MVIVEILTVGNEILLGRIEDTNSNYLCRVVRGMGGQVRHIAVVSDEVDAIAGELQHSLDRGPKIIFTCGGLGPTEDDVTLAGVAKATERKLEVNADALEFVARRYTELAQQGYVSRPEMNEARVKMATLPDGAGIIENQVGAAPAVVLDVNDTRIVSLPGVPAELKAIVEGPLLSLLAGFFDGGSYHELEMIIGCGDESVLAPALKQVAQLHPDVYLKSRANRFGPDARFRIVISASAKSSNEAHRKVASAASDLTRTLKAAGISAG